MIEILPGIFYDPSKEWYEQDPRLIALALEVEQTQPIDMQMEVSDINPARQRLLWAKWNHTTEMGTFEMRVDMHYLYSIDSKPFMTKSKHNSITITAI